MYNKFNYEKLNASQYIVVNSTTFNGRDTHQENSSDVLPENKYGSPDSRRSLSRFREIHTDTSVGRTMTTRGDNESLSSESVWKRQSTLTRSNSIKKTTKMGKLKKMNTATEAEMTRQLTSEYCEASSLTRFYYLYR